jgi:hypothetical protein
MNTIHSFTAWTSSRPMVWRIAALSIACACLFSLTGCFEYRLRVGSLAVHKKIMLRNDKAALAKHERGVLRNAPSFSAGVSAYLEPGTELEPLRLASYWYYVKTPQGRQGWIYQSQVYRIPVAKPIYDLQYRSDDNHAIIASLPLVIIMVCSLFFFNNRFTRTVLLPVLLLLILLSAVYFSGTQRATMDRHTHTFKKISGFLNDKAATVYVTDYLWSNRVNFWTGYTRHFSYYHSSKQPNYNSNARIRTLRASTDWRNLHGVYIIVDPAFFEHAATIWELPEFASSGVYPANWESVLSSGSATLYWAR